jgi:putative endonuclease
MPRQPHQTGQIAEILCLIRLWLTGWHILETRWRCPAGEIDLIASRGKQLCFIEVKARSSHRAALESISATQQQRIQRAASVWLAKHPKYADKDCGFDVMSVSHWPWPKRHRHMFELH